MHLYYLMIILEILPCKSENFSNEAINFITNSKNNKSTKTYDGYQKEYAKYCRNNKTRNEA